MSYGTSLREPTPEKGLGGNLRTHLMYRELVAEAALLIGVGVALLSLCSLPLSDATSVSSKWDRVSSTSPHECDVVPLWFMAVGLVCCRY